MVHRRTRELAKSRRRLESALEGANMGMWEIDLLSGERYCDERLATLLEYSEEELATYPGGWKKLIHPDDLRNTARDFRGHISGESAVFESEHRVKTKSGGYKWFLSRGRVVEHDQSGKPVRVAGTLLDINPRKEAEQEQRESEERFRRVFESVPDMIVLKDADRRLSHVNPAMVTLMDRSTSELVGLRAEDLFESPYSEQIVELDRRVLDGETIEAELTRPLHGVPMTFLDIRTPLRNGTGEVTGICVVSRDITGRKRVLSSESQVEEYPSPAMQETLQMARRCAHSDAFVLLQGESGTGKDYLAKWIHDRSKRAGGAFFTINCAALPDQMLESELFGHERGAYTGAVSRKRGLVELSEGGTLLLNEIGELPLSLQSKLLTFLDSKRFHRVGGEKPIRVDARIMAASHRNLKEEVRKGHFMDALYYRLNVLTIRIPPLRERLQDLRVIIQQILGDITKEIPSPQIPQVSPRSFKRLASYHWPGNIRELRNVVERAVILAQGPEIDVLPPPDASEDPLPVGDDMGGPTVRLRPDETLDEAKNDLIRAMCTHALKRFGGNKKAAASSLGVSRDAFYRYLRKLDIQYWQ
jgi:PAS domain S-box-containing protein